MAAAPAANSSTTGCRRCTALSCKDRLDWEATTVTAATVDTAPLCTIYSIPTPRVGYSRAELQYSLQWSCGQGRACGDCAAHESNRFGDAVAPLCKRPTDRSVCSTQRGQQWHDTTVAAHNSGSSGSIQQWQHTAVAAYSSGSTQHFRSNLSKKRCRGCLVACYMLHAARCTPHAPSEFFLHGARCVSYLASCMLDLVNILYHTWCMLHWGTPTVVGLSCRAGVPYWY
jgi:hypothetical protein